MLCLCYFFLYTILVVQAIDSQQQQQQQQAPALLLTTYDSISIIYPKEMGYEKDFIQTLYKINDLTSTMNETIGIRIEDAVYDQIQSSVYFIMSMHRIDHVTKVVTNLGCELIKLKHQQQQQQQQEQNTVANHVVALNWSRNLVYKNETVSILSMQMNEKKRKLYWLEYNYFSNRWSVVVMKMLQQQQEENTDMVQYDYYTFTRPSIRFSTDGYSFISVVYDTLDEVSIRSPFAKKFSKKKAELVLFITNNQTLNICFLSNLTCRNFFETQVEKVDYEEQGEEYYDDDEYAEAITTTTTTTTEPTPTPHEVTFGRLMGIQYDHKEHTLYIADYGYDRIEKMLIEVNNEELSNKIVIKETGIQTLVQSSAGQLPINPIMSVAYENNIFWTDFEDGLKSTIYKSPCIRAIYRVKNATTLKLIHILAKASESSNSNKNQNGYRLSSIQNNPFQYPPDYQHSALNTNEYEALVSSSNSQQQLATAAAAASFIFFLVNLII